MDKLANTSGMSQEDQRLLEKCKEIELLNRDLYYCFADAYKVTHEAELLWRKTAREEQDHADQFSLALKLHRGLQVTTGISLEKAEHLIQQLTAVIDKMAREPLSLSGALAFAIKLEHHLSDFHLSCMAEFRDVSFRNLFQAMMSSDQEHIAALEQYLQTLAAPAAAEA